MKIETKLGVQSGTIIYINLSQRTWNSDIKPLIQLVTNTFTYENEKNFYVLYFCFVIAWKKKMNKHYLHVRNINRILTFLLAISGELKTGLGMSLGEKKAFEDGLLVLSRAV